MGFDILGCHGQALSEAARLAADDGKAAAVRQVGRQGMVAPHDLSPVIGKRPIRLPYLDPEPVSCNFIIRKSASQEKSNFPLPNIGRTDRSSFH